VPQGEKVQWTFARRLSESSLLDIMKSRGHGTGLKVKKAIRHSARESFSKSTYW